MVSPNAVRDRAIKIARSRGLRWPALSREERNSLKEEAAARLPARPIIASIHIPKCAGSSLRRALRTTLKRNVVLDYGDRVNDYSPSAEAHRVQRRASIAALVQEGTFHPYMIHGHFYADKYLGLGLDLRWATMVRDPRHLLLSLYLFLRRMADRGKRDMPILRKASQAGSLGEFVEDPDYQNVMSRMMGPLDINDFALIGTLDDFSGYVASLERLVGRKFGEITLINRNPAGSRYEVSPETTRRIEALNDRDMALWERVRLRQRNGAPTLE